MLDWNQGTKQVAAIVPEEDKNAEANRQAEDERKVQAEKPGSGVSGPDLFANLPGYSPHTQNQAQQSFGQPVAHPDPAVGSFGLPLPQDPNTYQSASLAQTPGYSPMAQPPQWPGQTVSPQIEPEPPAQQQPQAQGQGQQSPGQQQSQQVPNQTQIQNQAQIQNQPKPVNPAQTAAEAAAQGWPQAPEFVQTQAQDQYQSQNQSQNPYPQLQIPQARPVFPQLQLPAPQNNPAQQQPEQRPIMQPMPYVRRNELDEQNQSLNRTNQRPAPANNQEMLPQVPETPLPQRGSREEMDLINQQFINNQYVPTTPPSINAHDANKPWNQEERPQFELFAEGYEEAIQKAKLARDQMKKDGAPPAKPTAWQETFAQVIESQNQSIEAAQQAAQAQAAQQAAWQQARVAGDGGPSALSESLSTAPPKEISRGAAALRAAGIYNKENAQGKEAQPETGLQLNKKDVFGIIVFNLLLAKNIIRDPRTFFERMLLNGQVTEPVVFLLVLETTTCLLRCITKFSLIPLFTEFLMGLISTILGAFLINFIFQRFDNKSDPYNCLRVICYSKAPMILGFLALGKFELGAYLAACYSIYLNYLGLSRVYRTRQNTTLIIIVIMAFLGVFFRQGAP